jgi:hypothetical protein
MQLHPILLLLQLPIINVFKGFSIGENAMALAQIGVNGLIFLYFLQLKYYF